MTQRGQILSSSADSENAILGLGIDEDDAVEAAVAASTAAIAAHAALVSATGVHGRLKQVLVAGGDETGAGVDITVSGMAVGDALVSVLVFTTAASIASAAFRAVADFTVAAGKLTVVANAVNNTNNQYLISYLDAA